MFALFLVIFLSFITLVLFKNPITQFTRAKEDITPSSNETLIFAWPLSVPANGINQSKVTVFIRSLNGKPVVNHTVTLSTTLGAFKENNIASDDKGQSIFTLTGTAPGVASISAVIDNTIPVINKISVKFL